MADEGIQGLGRLLARLAKLKTDTQNVERPLKAAGVYMLGSIEKNFKAQGRPAKWEGLKPSTLKRRRRGRGRGSARILIDTAGMKNAVAFRVHTEGLEIGLNKVQARRQHFGFPGGPGRGHSRTPARPFLMFQDEDITEVGNIFRRHIER